MTGLDMTGLEMIGLEVNGLEIIGLELTVYRNDRVYYHLLPAIISNPLINPINT